MNAGKMLSSLMMLIVTTVFSTQDLVSMSGGVNVAPPSSQEGLKAQILAMPPGSVIEVRMQDKRKLRGRLGEVTDDGFEMQHAKKESVVKESVYFKDIKSIKKIDREGMSTGTKIAWALAGVGIFFIVMSIVVAAGGGL